jgi:hypothetical protein
MASGVQNVVTMIAATDQRSVAPCSVWQERASEVVVIALAVLLLLPVLLTFTILALFVARIFGVPIGGPALAVRQPPQHRAAPSRGSGAVPSLHERRCPHRGGTGDSDQ